tara:strand:+ start:427 stop:738 length:312 start_codon:yes stop_codon:yes gene_type:complete
VPPKVGSAMPEVTVPGNLCAAFKSLYPRGQVAVKWPLGLSAPTKLQKSHYQSPAPNHVTRTKSPWSIHESVSLGLGTFNQTFIGLTAGRRVLFGRAHFQLTLL